MMHGQRIIICRKDELTREKVVHSLQFALLFRIAARCPIVSEDKTTGLGSELLLWEGLPEQ